MNTFDKIVFNIKLIGIWFYRILFAKAHMKVNVFKRIYYAFFGFKADQVVLYSLNNKNRHDYLSEFDWYKSRKINGRYSFLLNNKVVATDLLKPYVKVPNIYFIKNNGYLNGTNNDIYNRLKENKTLYIKPIGKGGGSGVKRFDYRSNSIYIDDIKKSRDELFNYLDRCDNYFIMETINQSKYLDNIYDKTSNTIRMIALRDIKTRKFKIYFAVQRIGTKETIPVDNGSRGGLIANINLDTGILSSARSLHNTNIYDIHPDSKSKIKGAKVPNFDKIKEEVLELSNRFSYFNFIAWDILVTDKGLSIIEANTSSGVNIMQVFGGLKNKELGDFYRYYKAIK